MAAGSASCAAPNGLGTAHQRGSMRVEKVPEMTTVRTVVVPVLAVIVFTSLAGRPIPGGRASDR